jgi:hypothetical protein
MRWSSIDCRILMISPFSLPATYVTRSNLLPNMNLARPSPRRHWVTLLHDVPRVARSSLHRGADEPVCCRIDLLLIVNSLLHFLALATFRADLQKCRSETTA